MDKLGNAMLHSLVRSFESILLDLRRISIQSHGQDVSTLHPLNVKLLQIERQLASLTVTAQAIQGSDALSSADIDQGLVTRLQDSLQEIDEVITDMRWYRTDQLGQGSLTQQENEIRSALETATQQIASVGVRQTELRAPQPPTAASVDIVGATILTARILIDAIKLMIDRNKKKKH